ncbi:MAG: PAS domain S-box protein [Candidatus Micrarchaeota archaeon]|nr:PAS domain S-box protein [Candidatus Micrarchaeota archaeon]
MADPQRLESAVARIISIASAASDADQEQALAACISDALGVGRVTIIGEIPQGAGRLIDYVLNTRKPYVDNELSEYSSFPELTEHWSKGLKSCAVIPIMLGGRAASVIELLSNEGNKFSDELMADATHLSYLVTLAIAFRKEESKSARLASYFNSAFDSPVAQLLVSSEGSIVRFNPAAAAEFGKPELKGYKVGDLVGAGIKEVRERSRSGRELISKRSGKTYAIHASEAGANLLYMTVRDVTDKEVLSWATSLMGPSYGAGVVLLDGDLTVSYATQSMKRIIGYDSTLTISKNVIELLAERDKGAFKELVATLGKGPSLGTVGMTTDKGAISPIKFALSKRNGGYMLLFYDASAERYVDSMASAFNEFLDGASDIALRVDELGYIRYSNHAIEQTLGYDRAELLGKEINALYLDLPGLERDLGHARGGTKIDNSYTQLRAKDGRSVEATNSIRFFKSGDVAEYVIIAKELETKRKIKEMEDAIEKQQGEIKKLEGTGELKSQFIYNISHELKTPLTNIIGFSKLMYGGDFGQLNDDQKGHISTIIEEANRLMDMITQVLDAAKLDSNKMKLEVSEVDMRAVGENPGIRALEERARNKGLEFSWNVHYDVPPVMADYGRVMQVFVNLIGNSIKFTEKGSITVDIRNRTTKKGRPNYIECSIIDTGIGVSEEGRHRLFREFYGAARTKSTIKQKESGTGLGLSITKKIVELHGGKINYEPREGGGSRFWFILPIRGRRKREG